MCFTIRPIFVPGKRRFFLHHEHVKDTFSGCYGNFSWCIIFVTFLFSSSTPLCLPSPFSPSSLVVLFDFSVVAGGRLCFGRLRCRVAALTVSVAVAAVGLLSLSQVRAVAVVVLWLLHAFCVLLLPLFSSSLRIFPCHWQAIAELLSSALCATRPVLVSWSSR